MEQRGRIVEIVYKLDNIEGNFIEGFEAFEEDDSIDEVGFEVTGDDEGLFEDEDPESALRERVRSTWVRIQLGNMKRVKILEIVNKFK